MIAKFLRSRRRGSSDANAAIPAGQRVYAIGDIHGRLDLLDLLLAQIDADDAGRGPAETTLIFLGDLVDRGDDSAGVVTRLLQLSQTGRDVRVIAGNHEEILLSALDGDAKALRLFCRVGGRETMLSYGLSAPDYERLDYAEVAERLGTLVPPEHQAFLRALETMVVIGDYAFVHAGVRPSVALDAQRPADLRWIRDPFLDHRGLLEKRIVHGHTVSEEVEWLPHRIGIDTGAYTSGRLTALGLQDDQSWTLEAILAPDVASAA